MDYPDILERLKQLAKAPVQVQPALVKAVDPAAYTVDVEFLSGALVSHVRLRAAIDEEPNAVVLLPKVDSSVLVGIIGNDTKQCFVIKCSVVEKVVGVIEGAEFTASKDGLEYKVDGAELKITKDEFSFKKGNTEINAAAKILLKVGSKSVGAVLDTFFAKLATSQVLTPTGPGSFKPDTIADIQTAKADLATILQS